MMEVENSLAEKFISELPDDLSEARVIAEVRFYFRIWVLSPNSQPFKEPKNRFQGTNSARLCSLGGRYYNPIPTRFLAPIDCLQIPAVGGRYYNPIPTRS